ncbi:DUF1538 domain-containing protein [Eubacterium limosum]|uniref:DUF1538 domain-containing protein n=1 Tax=Eubacterium limosum TaxID=1736 RepID=UPI001FA94899|nr:DUF1538 domain-containing protein [Eubacterium limosum]
MKKLLNSFKEVLVSILPMTVLIMIISGIWAPFTPEMLVSFIGGAIMMMIGMALFLFGADISMMEVGERVGNFLVSRRSLKILIAAGFFVGMFVTIAEPDVQVLAGQVAAVSDGTINRTMLIAVVGVGVGIFLVIALLRFVFQMKLYHILIIGYITVFVLSFFTNPEMAPVAFDSGGVTTGPITVPFILSLGSGITSGVRTSREGTDSFGMVALSSLGPVLAVMILGVIFR